MRAQPAWKSLQFLKVKSCIFSSLGYGSNMGSEALLFLFAVIMAAVHLFVMVFFVSFDYTVYMRNDCTYTQLWTSQRVVLFLRRCQCQWNLNFSPYWKTIMYADLECDYINPIDLCSKLNQASFSILYPWISSKTIECHCHYSHSIYIYVVVFSSLLFQKCCLMHFCRSCL